MLMQGKNLAGEILEEIRKEILLLDRKPMLALIIVGEHPASLSYIRGKKKACEQVGMVSLVIQLRGNASEEKLLEEIEQLNHDPIVDGILVQMPLPEHMNPQKIQEAIHPAKDVDGFHPLNVGKLLLGEESGFIPCTPRGIFALLERYEVPVEGKHAVIVGRSNIVGKPLAALLMQKKRGCNATVTLAHSKSEGLETLTRSADILVAAMGSPFFIKKEMVKPHAAVIDVGINRLADGRLVGDVDFAEVSSVSKWITPVPGGVGPMTIAMLIQNTLEGFKKRI